MLKYFPSLTTVILFFFFIPFTNAQMELNLEGVQTPTPNKYDFSQKFYPNIEVKLWGSVKNTGIYKVNEGTNLLELLTYSGGLKEDAELDDIRIIRLSNDSTKLNNQMIVINYDDMFNEEELEPENFKRITLNYGDIIVVPRSSSWIQDIQPFTTIVALIASLASTIYLLTRIN